MFLTAPEPVTVSILSWPGRILTLQPLQLTDLGEGLILNLVFPVAMTCEILCFAFLVSKIVKSFSKHATAHMLQFMFNTTNVKTKTFP